MSHREQSGRRQRNDGEGGRADEGQRPLTRLEENRDHRRERRHQAHLADAADALALALAQAQEQGRYSLTAPKRI